MTTIKRLFSKSIFATFCLLLSATQASIAQGGGGGGGGGGGLSCGDNGSYTMPNSTSAQNPTTTNCFNGPSYYGGSDVDGDGCEDVNYSVENNTFFTFTGLPGTGCITYDFTFTPTIDLNLQATIFPPVTGSTPCGCTGYDGNNSTEYGGSVNGSGSAFTLSVTICEGDTWTIMTDGYAGDQDGSYVLNVSCPCVPPTITATSSVEPICPGQSTTLTASGALTYVWSPSLGLSSTTGTSVTATPSSTTTYTVTGTDADGCEGETTITVSVDPPPVPDAGLDQSGCVGDVFTIGADPIYPVAGTDYSWSSGASGTLDLSGGGQDHGTTDVSPATTTTYTLTIDDGGCTGVDEVTITILPVVIPTFGALGPYCEGDATGGFSNTSDNSITGSWDAAVSTASAGTITYTFTPDPGQCAGPVTMDVVVDLLPIPDAGSDIIICIGFGTTLGADPIYGVAGAAYSWTSGASGTLDLSGGGQDHGQTDVTPGATTTYTVTVTNAAGCTGTDDITITVDPCGLPIELTDYWLVCDVNPSLHWETASEYNNDYFTIERSCDMINFEEIARVEGHENSVELAKYVYRDTDRSVCEKTSLYYRLSQTDLNGDEEELGIIMANCGDELAQPVIAMSDQSIFISYEEKFELFVYATDGKLLMSTNSIHEQVELNKLDFNNGAYIIHIISDQLFTERVMIAK